MPYAKKWQKETDSLRKIALDCDLTEEMKWGKPCFTYQKKNVAIIIPLKDSCALSFFKGALLKDPKHILQKIGEAQAGRWIKFSSPKEISALQPVLRDYIYEAIQVEASGKKVPLKKVSEYVVPEELRARLNAAPELKAAFEAVTPGRRKSYIFHVSRAKQAKTRAARAERCVPMILSGPGIQRAHRLIPLSGGICAKPKSVVRSNELGIVPTFQKRIKASGHHTVWDARAYIYKDAEHRRPVSG